MSYVDGNSGSRNKAVTGGVVALLQFGFVLALVNGFAVKFFPPEKPRNLPSQLYPTAPLPPKPTEPPKTETPQILEHETRIDTPQQRITLTPQPTITTTPTIIDLPSPTGGIDGPREMGLPTVGPSEPPARFTPRTARPRGNVAGWVTTEDYPTMDIRSGHTGTVRFRLAIDGAGKVADCTITQSSGFPGLDAATCRNVSKRARFDAASDGTGAKVAGSYDGTIRWVIPQD